MDAFFQFITQIFDKDNAEFFMVFRQFYAFFDAMAYGFMMYQNQRVNNEDNTTNTDELSLDFTDLDD